LNLFDYIEKYKIISAVVLIWTYGLLTWVIYRVFDDVSLINAAVVSALGTVVGVPAAAVALFKWRRGGGSDNG
jgi:uncharacterized MnhB-related membrane protein